MKRPFSQCVCVLLDRPTSLDAIEPALRTFNLIGQRDNGLDWPFGSPELILDFRSNADRYALIDVVNRPWPDAPHHDETGQPLEAAWRLGCFGPVTRPGCLTRAAAHAWAWAPAKAIPERHRTFLRVRTTIPTAREVEDGAGAGGIDGAEALLFATEVAAALLDVEGALCVFNPGGEALRGADFLRTVLERHRAGGPPPLEAWANIRLFRVVEAEGWLLMDTVGMGQLDRTDHEAAFFGAAYDRGDVDAFLRDASVRDMIEGPVTSGDTLDGPGGIAWRGNRRARAMVGPSRPVVRWLPLDGRAVPAGLVAEDPTETVPGPTTED